MIHFEGDKSFPLPRDQVAARLSDVRFLVGSLPDVEVQEIADDHATWKLRPKLSFLTGTLTVEMTTTERRPGESVTYQVLAKTIGASSTVVASLTFRDAADAGTVVRWTGDITEVTGLLRMVPSGLLQGSAQKVIDEVWAAVTARLLASDPEVGGQ